MNLEITPEPDDAERAAIEAALEAEEKESEQAEALRTRTLAGAAFLRMCEECIRCNEAPAVDEQGYCGHCHWAVRAEVEEGLYEIGEYLRAWARFDEWCESHPAKAA